MSHSITLLTISLECLKLLESGHYTVSETIDKVTKCYRLNTDEQLIIVGSIKLLTIN